MDDKKQNTTAGEFYFDESRISSRLSLKPLIRALKKNIEQGNSGVKKLYGKVVSELESHPELLSPITDLSLLKPHTELLEELMTSIFPPTTVSHDNLHAVSLPFKFQTVYSTKVFRHLFLKPDSDEINIPDSPTGVNLNQEKLQFAYDLILKKFCGHHHHQTSCSVHPYIVEHTGLTKYLELKIDARFIDVTLKDEKTVFPESLFQKYKNRIPAVEELMEELPIDDFIFDGIAIVYVNDVTEQQVISLIKNSLLNINTFSDASLYMELENHVKSLVGVKDVRIGVTPFFKVNSHYIYSELHNSNSLLFKHFHSIIEKDEISDCCKILFRESRRPVVFEKINEALLQEAEYLQYYFQEGVRSLIICPLKNHQELLGILEIVSDTSGLLTYNHVAKIESAIPLFTLALEKSAESLDTQIDKIIKEQFTAVQPAVEWRFTEAALNYIVHKQKHEEVKIEKINFPDVYPLFGSIDIRNSSTERSHSIQLDFIKQLELARKVIRKAQAEMPFPLLQEIEFKIEKYIASTATALQSDDETGIHDFLHGQVTSIFNHLHNTQHTVKKDIEHYFASLDPQLKMIYHHRKEYEQSIARINDVLTRFIDKEQANAQKVFPHYFERYVTDGVEFNIYMGQSISPRKKFDEIYLRNMRMWQLTLLTKAARITHDLEQQLSHSLQTTQLILAHSVPLTITFRTEERKFDVDGAYNIRYEILKKRIDKVRVKDTNERLTQPGKVAIVYSQPKDATEYLEYIEYLQNQQLLKPGTQHFDLEELQGVIGLKALRVDVNFDSTTSQEGKIQLSGTTSNQLLGK